MNKSIFISGLLLTLALGSCYKDKGNYGYKDAEIRAQRRYDELKAKGQEASFDEILENVKQRDYIDQNREVSPLRKAEDALLLDNTHLSIEEQKEWLFGQFNKVSK